MFFHSILLCFLFFIKISAENYTIIATNGSPESYGNYTIIEIDWDGCLAHCRNASMCMVVYNNGSDNTCLIFKIGQLEAVKRRYSPEFKVGFKIKENGSETCPADDTYGGQSYILGKNEKRRDTYSAFSFAYDPSTEVWQFKSTLTECPTAGNKLFLRPAGPWCISMVSASRNCTARDQAAEACSLYNKQLSGLETREEFDWVKSLGANLGWDNKRLPLAAAWLDGVRRPECIGNSTCTGLNAFQFTDPTLSSNPTGFLWNPNQPDSRTKDCLTFRTNSDGTFGVDDALCTMARSTDNKTCFSASVCGGAPNLL